MSTGDDLHLGEHNVAESPTRIECTPQGVNESGLDVVNFGKGGIGISGGVSPTTGNVKDNIAVSGFCGGTHEGIGVQGEVSQGVGVLGRTSLGSGVQGWDEGKQAGFGVRGTSNSGVGVDGSSSSNVGVSGSSSSGDGVSGSSKSAAGVHGSSDTHRGGVFGSNKAAQLRLVPLAPLKGLPDTGEAGDILVAPLQGGIAAKGSGLYFCVESHQGNMIPAKWKRIVLVDP
jgi:hypothetical protein